MKTRMITGVLCVICFIGYLTTVQTQTVERPNRFMDEDNLILFNVAVKGRVVELLANEIARTEIIRALLYEYAKECVQNVTVLEKSCYDCMVERCENRLAHCSIKNISLSEVIKHQPSPIQGLQFLSNAPKKVTDELKDFADNARADILRDIPDKLRGESEKIVHSEVDESLSELKQNMNTEKALQTITIHFQKAANNVHLLPDLGEKLATFVVENGDHAVNIAELLATKLHDARPYLDSMQHNGQKVKEQAPGIWSRLGQRVSQFKNRVVGVFNSALDTFQQVLDNPDTTVVQGNQQLNTLPGSAGQQFVGQMGNPMPMQGFIGGPGQPVRSQFQSDFGPITARQFIIQDPNQARQVLRQLEVQVQNQLQGLWDMQQRGPLNQQQFLQNNPQMQNMQMSQGIHQPSLTQNIHSVPAVGQMQANGQMVPSSSNQGQGQLPGPVSQQQMMPNILQSPTQLPQNQQMPQQMQPSLSPIAPRGQPIPVPQQNNPVGQQGQNFQGQAMNQGQIVNNQFPVGQNQVPLQPGQQMPVQPTAQMGVAAGNQGQPMVQGRRRRQAEPDCDKLRYDPETYCKTYESQCHNCTLEKRLRFEVCGEGVEKARDEIKRLDNSVQNYLEAYDDHVAYGPLVLKVELNDTNRLSKTNTYYDAYITAKIGAAIIRYKTKMILNINDLHVSGSQIGDEIWEKLWEQNVFSEAQRLNIVHTENGDMGQLHKFDVKVDTDTKTEAHKSSSGSLFTTMTSLVVGLAGLLLHLL